MSRIDEALRRAARGEHAEAVGNAAPSADPVARAVAPSFLERYAAEKPISAVSPVRTASRDRAPLTEPAPARSSAPAVPTVTYRAQLAGFAPTLQGKLVISGDATHVSVEQYRRLAATVHGLQSQRGLKTLMVSSAIPREGKTLTVANLALTLTESYNQRVLLIDVDLRRPSVHDLFGFPNTAGLADLVRRGTGDLPFVEIGSRLTVLPAGRLQTAAPTAELTSDCMRTVISEAAARFDWVLLDTPPVGLLPDAHLIARVSEGVLFVIAAGMTPYTLVQRAIAELGPERIIGTVLNRVAKDDMPVSTYYNRYYDADTSERRAYS
jgi:capsular exopolysaccharide synthesis family protein